MVDVRVRDQHARDAPLRLMRGDKPAIVMNGRARPEAADQAEAAPFLAAHVSGMPPQCSLKAGRVRDLTVPAIEIRHRRPLRHQFDITAHHHADRNVAVGERVAGQELRLAELGVHDLRGGGGLLLAGVDRRLIALLRRRADQAPEHRRDRRAHHGQLPVHPLAGERALLGVLRFQHAALVVLAGEIAHDGIGFPQQEAVFLLERRHEAVRDSSRDRTGPWSCRTRRRHRCARAGA